MAARPAVLTAHGSTAVRARTGPFRGPGPAEVPVPCPLGLRGQAAGCSITFSGSRPLCRPLTEATETGVSCRHLEAPPPPLPHREAMLGLGAAGPQGCTSRQSTVQDRGWCPVLGVSSAPHRSHRALRPLTGPGGRGEAFRRHLWFRLRSATVGLVPKAGWATAPCSWDTEAAKGELARGHPQSDGGGRVPAAPPSFPAPHPQGDCQRVRESGPGWGPGRHEPEWLRLDPGPNEDFVQRGKMQTRDRWPGPDPTLCARRGPRPSPAGRSDAGHGWRGARQLGRTRRA